MKFLIGEVKVWKTHGAWMGALHKKHLKMYLTKEFATAAEAEAWAMAEAEKAYGHGKGFAVKGGKVTVEV